MKFVVWPVVLIVVVLWDVVIHGTFLVEADSSLIGPAPCNILDGVATTSKYEQWQTPGLHNLDALRMALDRTVVSAKLVVSN